jgi:hypothetical protein
VLNPSRQEMGQVLTREERRGERGSKEQRTLEDLIY